MARGIVRDVLFGAAILLAGPVGQGSGARLRSRHGSAIGDSEVTLEVVENKSLVVEGLTECLCKPGQFWHWRVKECIGQGGWGYECGFFPAEHHHRVCKDGLMCKPLGGKDTYTSPGLYEGTARSFPATCVQCASGDKCKAGEERHKEDCLKEYTVSGEACATVRVTMPASTEAAATKSHTAKAEATKEETATATAQAAQSQEVTANATASHEASAEKTAEASHTAEAKTVVVAEAKKCMSAEEAMKMAGYKPDAHLSAVPAAEVRSMADKKVFELAAAEAKKLAAEKGLLDAQAAAKKVAGEEAAEEARLKAEAEAREAAAWKAEAGANEKAQEAAEERAKALAKEASEAGKDKGSEKETPGASKETEPTTEAPKPEVPSGPPATEPLVPPQKPVSDENKFRKITDDQFKETRP